MPDKITMTKEEWHAKGKDLFGDDLFKWRFVCPGCGHVQSIEDFRRHKDAGATPESARCECIGRYTAGKSWANDNPRKTGGPCDYAGYGLLNICPIKVIGGDKTTYSFAFDESTESIGHSNMKCKYGGSGSMEYRYGNQEVKKK